VKLKKIYRLLIILPLFALTGCFEAIEEINLNDDGSGSFAFTINLSQSKAKIATALLADTINGQRIPSRQDIINEIKAIAVIAEKNPGIKDVKVTHDFDNFVFSFRCSFTDLHALNTFLDEVKKKHHGHQYIGAGHKHFDYDKKNKIYTRNANYATGDASAQLRNIDKAMFSKAIFVSISRFNSEVTTVTNTKATIAPSKKAVLVKVSANELLKGTQIISNKITLTK
jgi:hypothetical protein